MFKLHSIWRQVFNTKQFGEFCYLKQKGLRFISDFHSRNLLNGLKPLSQKKKKRKKKRMLEIGSSSFWQKNSWLFCMLFKITKLLCHKRSYPLLQHQEIPILPWNCCRVKYDDIISFYKCRAQNSCDDELPSPFFPSSLFHFLLLVSAELSLLRTRNSKQEKQNKRTTGYILFFFCYLESLLLL